VTVSIIIVSYNARADLERCLASLRDAPPSAPSEVIVVDNASEDGSAATARAFPGVQVIASPTNCGFAAANNLGIRASTGANLLLLNSDTIVPPGTVDTLLGELDRHPEAAVVGPRLVDGSGRPELSFGRMITPVNELRQKRLGRRYERGDPSSVGLVESMTHREHWPDWVSGACLLVRRGDAEAVGLLDERFFLYTEDVDFCASLRARGRRVLFTPAAEVVHLRGRSGTASPVATQAAYRRSHLAFYQKHHPRLAPLLRLYHRLTRSRQAKPSGLV
jgi:GT2 family glycosyltransferase